MTENKKPSVFDKDTTVRDILAHRYPNRFRTPEQPVEAPQTAQDGTQAPQVVINQGTAYSGPKKSKGIFFWLWLLGGLFGIHRFYLGQFGMGFLYLFTGGLLGVGWALDFFRLSQLTDLANYRNR